MRPKQGLLLFITSCLSGCGQMYQGYMKRGVSLLLGFFVILAIAGFLGLGAVAFFLPVVLTAITSAAAFWTAPHRRMNISSASLRWTASAWQSCCAAATASSVGDW